MAIATAERAASADGTGGGGRVPELAPASRCARPATLPGCPARWLVGAGVLAVVAALVAAVALGPVGHPARRRRSASCSTGCRSSTSTPGSTPDPGGDRHRGAAAPGRAGVRSSARCSPPPAAPTRACSATRSPTRTCSASRRAPASAPPSPSSVPATSSAARAAAVPVAAFARRARRRRPRLRARRRAPTGCASNASLILAGVAVAALCSAVQTFLLQQRRRGRARRLRLAARPAQRGRLGRRAAARCPTPCVSPRSCSWSRRSRLDVLAVGDEEAEALGARPGRRPPRRRASPPRWAPRRPSPSAG